MKRSRAFILTELLTGMALQAGFLLVLCTSFYMMISFYTRTQQVLSARDKGQRVIAYFDQRIRHAGLGMWRCTSSQDIREALWPLTDPSKTSVNLRNTALAFPVAITTLSKDFDHAYAKILSNSVYHRAYSGNILTLIYAERDTSTIQNGADKMNLVFSSEDYEPIEVGKGGKNGKFKLIDEEIIMSNSNFKKDKVLSETNPYAVTRSIGRPFQVKDITSGKKSKFVISLDKSIDVLPMDELLYLKCVRVFVEGSGVDSNFKYQNLTSKWSDKIPHEKGILEIYMELDIETKIFDLYVLSTGGEDNNTTRTKPENWPARARWKNEYLNHVLYVSHASWRLHNIKNMDISSKIPNETHPIRIVNPYY